jgi:hypothetical protein
VKRKRGKEVKELFNESVFVKSTIGKYFFCESPTPVKNHKTEEEEKI